jgi:hypothetical protein
LKNADDRVVKNLLVAKVIPDGAHDQEDDASLHPALPSPACGLRHAPIGFRRRVPDATRNDAVGF